MEIKIYKIKYFSWIAKPTLLKIILYHKKTQTVNPFYFFPSLQAGGILSKSCYLIGSENGRYFTILPANPDGIVASFIHKFVCWLWMSKNRNFQTIFLLKLALLLALARETWILLFGQKIWRENQASQPGKPLQLKQYRGLVMSLH